MLRFTVCNGVSTPLKTAPPVFLAKPTLNVQTVQAPIFRQFPPVRWFFVNPLLKVGFFSEPPKY